VEKSGTTMVTQQTLRAEEIFFAMEKLQPTWSASDGEGPGEQRPAMEDDVIDRSMLWCGPKDT